MAENNEAMQEEINRLKAQLAESKKESDKKDMKMQMDACASDLHASSSVSTGMGFLGFISNIFCAVYQVKAEKALENGDVELANKYVQKIKTITRVVSILSIVVIVFFVLVAISIFKAMSKI